MTKTKQTHKKYLLLILIGSLFIAFAIVAFLIPHNIAAGGPPGVAILLNYFTGFAIGWGMFLVNMTLILISYKKFGGIYFVKTLVAVTALSIFSDVLTYLINGFIITDYRIINAVLGGLCAGFGIGLVSSAGAASGGWVALAQIIAERFKFTLGRTCFGLDFILLVVFSLVFREIETALYGLLTIVIVGKTIDFTIKTFGKKAIKKEV